jgi:glycosyltransferase involved in cell wall biosynthesis
VPPGDAGELVTAVRRVLDDPQLARSLGERGAKRAHDYAWTTVTERIEAVYRDVLRR